MELAHKTAPPKAPPPRYLIAPRAHALCPSDSAIIYAFGTKLACSGSQPHAGGWLCVHVCQDYLLNHTNIYAIRAQCVGVIFMCEVGK